MAITPTEAAVTAFGAVLAATAPALLSYRAKIKELEAEVALREVELKDEEDALSFSEIFAEEAKILDRVNSLCETTRVDRVLMLRAWNGKAAPKWTTATWQYRAGTQDQVSYVHTEIDPDYVARLSETETTPGGKTWATADLPPSLIRSIYEVEGVTSSSWQFIGGRSRSDGARAITYMSFATHSDEDLDHSDLTKIRIISDQIRGHFDRVTGGAGLQ